MKIKRGIWQKRFKKTVAREVLDFTSSVHEDTRLIYYDIIASLAHARMLHRQKIISGRDHNKIRQGLEKILNEHRQKKFKLSTVFEDVHLNIEHSLYQLIGDAAQSLHTARSRNDMIATDLRLYCREALIVMLSSFLDLQAAIARKAQKNMRIVWPGYTHLQQAQPILFAFYILAYFYKFQRDFEAIKNLIQRNNISPLGSCALAGTTHNIDPSYSTILLKFNRCFDNALDAVSDRDYLLAIIFSLTQAMLHVSSLAEDLIIFSTEEFHLVELDDGLATGSSIMPQKKNPDVCELLRAKAGKAIGNLAAAAAILKGLPQSYNRDLQELKGILFSQIDETSSSLKMLELVIATLKVYPRFAHQESLSGATDLVDYMVKKGHKFRNAYDLVTECVNISNSDINKFIKVCNKKTGLKTSVISKILKPNNSILSKISRGSTSFQATKKSIVKAFSLIRSNRIILKKMYYKLRLH